MCAPAPPAICVRMTQTAQGQKATRKAGGRSLLRAVRGYTPRGGWGLGVCVCHGLVPQTIFYKNFLLTTKCIIFNDDSMKPKNPPCLATLRATLIYDPNTGVFTRAITRGKLLAGSVAGSLNRVGYWQIGVCGRTYTAQRLAWYYVHGEWPDDDIDHINRDKLDNRIDNLRVISRAENLRNRAPWKWVNRKNTPRKPYTKRNTSLIVPA